MSVSDYISVPAWYFTKYVSILNSSKCLDLGHFLEPIIIIISTKTSHTDSQKHYTGWKLYSLFTYTDTFGNLGILHC